MKALTLKTRIASIVGALLALLLTASLLSLWAASRVNRNAAEDHEGSRARLDNGANTQSGGTITPQASMPQQAKYGSLQAHTPASRYSKCGRPVTTTPPLASSPTSTAPFAMRIEGDFKEFRDV